MGGRDPLRDAVEALKASTPSESLSSSARTALFSAIGDLSKAEGPGSLPSIARVWRAALLGALPVLVVAAGLIVMNPHDGRSSQTGRLTATKVDGEVIFTLANGTKQHMVYRSSDPREFDPALGVKMTGNRFTDEAAGGPSLVFYKID